MAKKKFIENGYVGWSQHPNNIFLPALPVRKHLEAGYYEVGYSDFDSRFYLRKVEVNSDKLFQLPSTPMEKIISQLKVFWSKESQFGRLDVISKYSALIYGPPGNSKSSTLKILSEEIITNFNGLVLLLNDSDQIKFYVSFIDSLRTLEKSNDRPILVLMEDIDRFLDENQGASSSLLSVLDGLKNVENIVHIATSNKPEKLGAALLRRFNLKIKIGYPDPATRRAYIQKKFTDAGFTPKEGIERVVSQTKGYSVSDLKDIIVSLVVFEKSLEEAIKEHQAMSIIQPSSSDKKDRIGFEINGNGHEK